MTIGYGAGANSWLSVSHRQTRADSQGGELVDRVAAGPPIGKFLVIEALGHVGCHSPGSGRMTAPGSSWPQSIRIVHRKRRPTSKVDSMTVLRARRGATGSK
jgi:hypothetical protein